MKTNNVELLHAVLARPFLLLCIMMISGTGAWGYDFVSDGIYYNIIDAEQKTVAVTYGTVQSNSYSGDVAIPETVINDDATYYVTEIDEYAFYDCSGLSSVTIPNSVVNINKYAFDYCNSLTSVTIPNSVVTIEYWAFGHCSNLASVTIGNNVETIGSNAFYMCTSLTEVIIPNSVVTIDNSAFGYCSKLTSVTLGNNVETIGSDAFYNCKNLAEVTLGDNVVTIGDYAFQDCSNLTSITIGDNVETIGIDAFSYCHSLTDVTIGSNVKNIGRYAFRYCIGLTEIICRATTQPEFGSGVFTGLPTSCTMYVPQGSVEDYKSVLTNYNIDITDKVSISIGETGCATYCSHADLDFTGIEGLTAYTVSGYDNMDGVLELEQVVNVPAGTGILLIGTEGEYEVPFVITEEDMGVNLLTGTLKEQELPTTTAEYTNYILANKDAGIGFYKSSGEGNIAAHKAYLQLPTSQALGINMLRIGDATGIDVPTHDVAPHGAVIYDLSGQQVEHPVAGRIYIINGKKVIFND